MRALLHVPLPGCRAGSDFHLSNATTLATQRLPHSRAASCYRHTTSQQFLGRPRKRNPEGATTKGMTTVSITQKDGTMQQIDKTNFASWKRKVGKHAGFHLTPHPGEELIVCTRSEMQQLPDGNFSAILVKKCKITDSELKKELRGFEVWKAV